MESALRNSQPFDLLNRLCELPGLDLQPYFALAPVPCKLKLKISPRFRFRNDGILPIKRKRVYAYGLRA